MFSWLEEARIGYDLSMAAKVVLNREVQEAVPVLVYRAPNICDYPARLSVNKLSEYFPRLAEEEYRYILPQDLPNVMARRKSPPDASSARSDLFRQQSGGTTVRRLI